MRGRNNGQGGTSVLDGTAHCDMCGTSVPYTEDGRCDLGHRIALPSVANLGPPAEAAQAETGPTVPPAAAAAATPPPSAAAPEVRTETGPDVEEDPFFHPYDEVLGDEAPKQPDPEPVAGLAPEELEDLLSWSEEM